MIAAALDEALKAAGLPVVGVSVGAPDTDGKRRPISDKAGWEIQLAPGATDTQKRAAQSVINAFDIAAEAAKPPPRTAEERLAAIEAYIAALKSRGPK